MFGPWYGCQRHFPIIVQSGMQLRNMSRSRRECRIAERTGRRERAHLWLIITATTIDYLRDKTIVCDFLDVVVSVVDREHGQRLSARDFDSASACRGTAPRTLHREKRGECMHAQSCSRIWAEHTGSRDFVAIEFATARCSMTLNELEGVLLADVEHSLMTNCLCRRLSEPLESGPEGPPGPLPR